jgi:hypothetical protein
MTGPPQLRKIIRLLSSPVEGEVVAAAAALNRALASYNLDIHDLAKAADAGLQLTPATKAVEPSPVRRPGGPLQMGEHIICDEVEGLFRRCRCGSKRFIVIEGSGPHAAQLRCDDCGSGGRWLGKTHFGSRT